MMNIIRLITDENMDYDRALRLVSDYATLHHNHTTGAEYPSDIFNSTLDRTRNQSKPSTFTPYYPHDDPPVIILIERYLTICLCVLGFTGNSFSSATFLSKQLRRSPCSVYLAARGVSDNIFLANLAVSLLGNMFELNFSHISGLCKSIVFSTYVTSFVSVWLTVLVTLENLVLLKHPYRAKTFKRNNLYKTMCVCLVVTSLAIYGITFWLVQNDCSYKEADRALVEYLILIDMMITFATPFIIIILLLTLTVIQMTHIKNTRCRNNSTSSYSETTSLQLKFKHKQRQPVAKVTIMLFVFTLTFILLHLPSHVLRSYVSIASKLHVTLPRATIYASLYSTFQILYYLSFSVNVVVFMGFGSNFRKLFQHNFCGFRTDFSAKYVPVEILNIARFRRQRKRQRRHTIAVDVLELSSITLSKEWLNLKPLMP